MKFQQKLDGAAAAAADGAPAAAEGVLAVFVRK
jgi:hypothetical protein